MLYLIDASKIRAVKKLKKVYMWDWSQVDEQGFRFENLVAGHLLKYCHFIEDTEGRFGRVLPFTNFCKELGLV